MRKKYEPGDVPKSVRALREERGWSQPKLAEVLGVSQTTVSAYELGQTTPSVEVLLKMAALAKKKSLRDAIDHQMDIRFSEFSQEFFANAARELKRSILTGPIFTSASQRPFLAHLTQAMDRPDAPGFLKEMAGLYMKFRNNPAIEGIFREATKLMNLQLQLAEMEEKQKQLTRRTTKKAG